MNLRASTCGQCHPEIYEEWKISTHARAWKDDAQFMEELAKSRKDQDVGWMCVNCHTPLENQLPKLVAAIEDGDLGKPIYVRNRKVDRKLQDEAITCAVCHVRDGTILGPRGGDELAKSPHPVEKSDLLVSAELCTRCHQATASFPDQNLACVFNTGKEMVDGPCQRCHMPEVERPNSVGGPKRKTRRHWFGGSLIPKHPRFTKEIEPLWEIYPDGMTVAWKALPKRLRRGRRAKVTFEIENAEAGHMLPTGDPERFILVTAIARSNGKEIARYQERIGSVYEWNPVRLVSDNRLKPKERRSYDLEFDVPDGPVVLELEASKWRISEENLRYHDLEGRYVPGRTFFTSTTKVETR